jgi:hypothetical protein
MPRDGAILFGDLIVKLDVLRVSCDKCGRDGCYGLAKLIDKRGRDGKLVDWLEELTADCPKKKSAHNMRDRCGAKCPQLPKVLYRALPCPLYPRKRTIEPKENGEEPKSPAADRLSEPPDWFRGFRSLTS